MRWEGPPPKKIAVVGDVHLRWGVEDVRFFNGSDYELVLFVGDIGGYRHSATRRVARSIAGLTKPAVLVAGNHDGPSLGQLASEVLGSGSLANRLGKAQTRRVSHLDEDFGSVNLSAYRVHELGSDLALVVGRPHSMGGPRMHFASAIERSFGVRSMADSADRLCALVEETRASRLLFLAHNGPTGLGDRRDDIWGCDFRRAEGDQGDPDLEVAVAHAVGLGRRVEAVLAGHMHRGLRGGGQRRWQLERAGTLYVNAARVPRVFGGSGQQVRHHVELLLGTDGASARDVLVDGGGRASAVALEV